MTLAAVLKQEIPGDGKVVLNQHHLKTLRKQRGLSQDGLAQLCLASKLCVSIASIKRAETGKPVLYRTASHLARIYQTSLDDLLPPLPSRQMTSQLAPVDDDVRTILALRVVASTALTPALAAQLTATME
ncbi:MAG: helix-turn-helix domain-containing protein [Pseudomonadota bacterium]|nr:helix-turn-helix domain-containing protein [Pseudomonadota bacterium]